MHHAEFLYITRCLVVHHTLSWHHTQCCSASGAVLLCMTQQPAGATAYCIPE